MTSTKGSLMMQSKNALKNTLKANPDSLKNIQHIVCFDEVDEASIKEVTDLNVQFLPFAKLLDEQLDLPQPKLSPEQTFSINFTSGTTGKPKGAIISHHNIVSCWFGLKDDVHFEATDVHLSYLPLAHTFERLFSFWVIGAGANVRFYSGNAQDLVKDMARVKPTIIPFVPRLLNKFYSMLKPLSHVPKELAEEAMRVKRENWLKGIPTSPYDDTVFKPVRDLFGGRLRLIISGAAPIAIEVLEFFMVVLGIDIREAYGQTEANAGWFTQLGEKHAGHVGGISRSAEFKFVDIPEMGYYTNKDPPTG
mgnify:FL=1